MYAHGIATIVLCRRTPTRDEALKDPAQRASIGSFAQHHRSGRNTGGWRYDPGQQGDTSVVGWQLMACAAERIAGLKVPNNPFVQAGKFLDYVQRGHYGGLYSYQRPQSGASDDRRGLLCRQYLGWPKSSQPQRSSISSTNTYPTARIQHLLVLRDAGDAPRGGRPGSDGTARQEP
jgi:hypothetical protein